MNRSRLCLVILGLVIAAGVSAANLVELGTFKEGAKIWTLSLDKKTQKLKLFVDWDPSAIHPMVMLLNNWEESSSLELDASGAILNGWANFLVCFRAVNGPEGGDTPKSYFLKRDQYGVAGLSCQLFPVEREYRAERRRDGIITYSFAGTYPMKPWFSFVWPR